MWPIWSLTVADIVCGRYFFGRNGRGRYGLWPISSSPVRIMVRASDRVRVKLFRVRVKGKVNDSVYAVWCRN